MKYLWLEIGSPQLTFAQGSSGVSFYIYLQTVYLKSCLCLGYPKYLFRAKNYITIIRIHWCSKLRNLSILKRSMHLYFKLLDFYKNLQDR